MALLTNDIYIGSVSTPLYHFTNANAELGGFKGNFALDVIGNELSIDTFTVTVRQTENDFYEGFITADDYDFYTDDDEEFCVHISEYDPTMLKEFMRELPFGVPVWWYVDGVFHAKGYLKSVDRVAKYGFKLTCVSGVGLLDADMHVGGIYIAAQITTVLASIIGGAFTYTVSNAVQSVYVYGRLPYDTRRNNLHRLLFATGAALQKGDASTDYVIDFLSETITEVPASRVALQGSVDYQLPSNKIEVTEHSYFYDATVATETLFDNTSEAVADNLTVIFQSPVYASTLATTGTLSIISSGVNYAVVSGQGTLTGKYYTHTTNIRTLTNNPNNDPERVRRVTENELVTSLNSLNVARRVLSYYQSAKTVKAKLLLDGEKCGQLIRMTDSFGDLTQAYLARMDTLVTSVIGAQCQMIEGYQPGANGNVFTHRIVIDAAYIAAHGNTIAMPADYVKIVLIGGGDGGSGGYDGEEGQYKYKGTSIFDPGEGGEVIRTYYEIDDHRNLHTYYYDGQTTAAGGAAGAAGSRGKVYAFEGAAVTGETVTISVGVGGAGGARNGGAGSSGTATTVSSTSLGTKSSNSGLNVAAYFDPFSGDVYASAGLAGVPGGGGGAVDTVNLQGNNGGNGLPGGNAGFYHGGVGGTGRTMTIRSFGQDYTGYLSGGGGGGAAFGANGGDGGNITSRYDSYYQSTDYFSGVGGNGANAVAHPKPTYGGGGGGGNGGGGGGNCGAIKDCFQGYADEDSLVYSHAGGAAGQGSKGGDGGDGVVIIYY